jgi:hypothetical protein
LVSNKNLENVIGAQIVKKNAKSGRPGMLHDVDLERDALILANARKIIKRSKSMTNAELMNWLFGYGHVRATDHCFALGLHPESNKTSYREMMATIKEASGG